MGEDTADLLQSRRRRAPQLRMIATTAAQVSSYRTQPLHMRDSVLADGPSNGDERTDTQVFSIAASGLGETPHNRGSCATHRRGAGSSLPAAGKRECSPSSSRSHSRSSEARKAATCLRAVARGCVSPDIETAIPGAATRRASDRDRSRPPQRTRDIGRGAAHDGRVSTLLRQPHKLRQADWSRAEPQMAVPLPRPRRALMAVRRVVIMFYLAPYLLTR